jgi:2'-5' RNA ligase
VAKNFIFLEVTDPEINSLVREMREIADAAPAHSNVHITIRGPYDRAVPAENLKRYERILSSDPIVLNGVGMFPGTKRHVVYMKVQHPKLRRIWWKPDFPISKYGFNPHITLYEGSDPDRAARLLWFLQREQLKLLTWQFIVSPYVTAQADLFPTQKNGSRLFLNLVNASMVRADILSRLDKCLRTKNQVA